MLGQAECASLLEQCGEDKVAMEEVLSAYVCWKLLKGQSCPQVLRKLHFLCIYLRVTNRGRLLTIGHDVFKIHALELATGGGLLGISPTTTPIGKELWNRIRRAQGRRPIATDGQYGGPASAFIQPNQLPREPPGRFTHFLGDPLLPRGAVIDPATMAAQRTAWHERYFRTRPQFENIGVPEYANYASGGGTLPLYASTASQGNPPSYSSMAGGQEISLLEGTPIMSQEEMALIEEGLEDLARELHGEPSTGGRTS